MGKRGKTRKYTAARRDRARLDRFSGHRDPRPESEESEVFGLSSDDGESVSQSAARMNVRSTADATLSDCGDNHHSHESAPDRALEQSAADRALGRSAADRALEQSAADRALGRSAAQPHPRMPPSYEDGNAAAAQQESGVIRVDDEITIKAPGQLATPSRNPFSHMVAEEMAQDRARHDRAPKSASRINPPGLPTRQDRADPGIDHLARQLDMMAPSGRYAAAARHQPDAEWPPLKAAGQRQSKVGIPGTSKQSDAGPPPQKAARSHIVTAQVHQQDAAAPRAAAPRSAPLFEEHYQRDAAPPRPVPVFGAHSSQRGTQSFQDAAQPRLEPMQQHWQQDVAQPRPEPVFSQHWQQEAAAAPLQAAAPRHVPMQGRAAPVDPMGLDPQRNYMEQALNSAMQEVMRNMMAQPEPEALNRAAPPVLQTPAAFGARTHEYPSAAPAPAPLTVDQGFNRNPTAVQQSAAPGFQFSGNTVPGHNGMATSHQEPQGPPRGENHRPPYESDRASGYGDHPRRMPNTSIWRKPYDGRNVDLANYLAMFDCVARAQGWDDTEKGMVLMANLDGRASGVVNNIPPGCISYDIISSKLRQMFAPEANVIAYKAQFQHRVRGPLEEAQDYSLALRELAGKAYPRMDHESLEQLMVDQYIRGQPSYIRFALASGSHTELNRAVATTIQLEAYARDPVAPEPAKQQGGRRAPAIAAASQAGPGPQNPPAPEWPGLYFGPSPPTATASQAEAGGYTDQPEVTDELLADMFLSMSGLSLQDTPQCHATNQTGAPRPCYFCGKPGHFWMRCRALMDKLRERGFTGRVPDRTNRQGGSQNKPSQNGGNTRAAQADAQPEPLGN